LSWSETSWFQLITLKSKIVSHLWTIPPEIKYYFFIPVFVFISHHLNKSLLIKLLWIICLAITLSIVEIFNLFGNKFDEHDSISIQDSNMFLTRFSTFFLGSLLALILSLIHEWEIYKSYENSKYFKLFFGTVSMVLYLAGMVLLSPFYNESLNDRYYFRCSVYWALFLFTFVIGGSNYFTDFFKLKLFSYGGKISFGFYLYHIGVIDFIFEHLGKKVKLKFELILYSFIVTIAIGFLHYLSFSRKEFDKIGKFYLQVFWKFKFVRNKITWYGFLPKNIESNRKSECETNMFFL